MAVFTAWPGDNFVWLHPRDISISKASLAIQEKSQTPFPTALPSHVPRVPAWLLPVPTKVPDAQSWGCPRAPPAAPGWGGGTEPGCQAPAVSSTTTSSIQKGGSCQQPIRQQQHPGTILAEENRKSSWSCCEAVTATSMAFIYFCECPYTQQLLCKWYISLQTAQFLLLAGNLLDSKSGFRAAGNWGLLEMGVSAVMVHCTWASTPGQDQQVSSQWRSCSKGSIWE